MSDVFVDHDLLPAPTSHAALSAEVARLRTQNQRLQEAAATFREIAASNLRECSKLSAEVAEVTMERDFVCHALQQILDVPMGESGAEQVQCRRCDDRNDIAAMVLAALKKEKSS